MPRHFTPPWTSRENEESYSVHDANGDPLAYVYFQTQPTGGFQQKRLTKDEARRIAAGIARLPELLAKG